MKTLVTAALLSVAVISAPAYAQTARARPELRRRACGAATTAREPPALSSAEGPRPRTPQTLTQRHFAMANLACYPAINVPNGFLEMGSPTNVTFYALPFGEMELIALAKAYQDAAWASPEAPGRG